MFAVATQITALPESSNSDITQRDAPQIISESTNDLFKRKGGGGGGGKGGGGGGGGSSGGRSSGGGYVHNSTSVYKHVLQQESGTRVKDVLAQGSSTSGEESGEREEKRA